jgi:hypothetical protein
MYGAVNHEGITQITGVKNIKIREVSLIASGSSRDERLCFSLTTFRDLQSVSFRSIDLGKYLELGRVRKQEMMGLAYS